MLRKWHNVPTEYRGQTYDSAGEAEYAARLDLLLSARRILWWDRPGEMVVDDQCVTCGARWGEPCTYRGKELKTIHKPRLKLKPDFYVIPLEGESFYVDYKALDRKTQKPITTPMFNRKVIQWRKNCPWQLRLSYKPKGSKKGDMHFEEKVICTGEEARLEHASSSRRKAGIPGVPGVWVGNRYFPSRRDNLLRVEGTDNSEPYASSL